MFNLLLVISLFIFLCIDNTPMEILMSVLFLTAFSIVVFFLYSLDYWFTFMVTMSFLVGLFLLFIYFVSLKAPSKNIKNSKKDKKLTMFINSCMATVFMFYTIKLNNTMMFMENTTVMSQKMDWMYEDLNELMGIMTLMFVLFIIFLFFFMKKNSKMMKSTI